MKRPSVMVAALYAAGLAAGLFLRLPAAAVLAAVAVIAVSQAVELIRGRRASARLLLAAVFLLGVVRQDYIERKDEAARAQLLRWESCDTVRVDGRLAATGRRYATRRTFRLKNCVVRGPDGKSARFPTAIQLVCAREAGKAVAERPPLPGDRVAVTGQLERPPDLSNPDVFNYRAYLERHGIGASVFVRDAEAVRFSRPHRLRSPVALFVAAGERLRVRIEAIFDRTLEPAVADLVRSIFLGQAYRLDRDLRRDFTRCGLAHIFAVSGLHVAILLWVLSTFIRLFGLRPEWRSLVLMAVLALFCAIVGFRSSAVRAGLMCSALLASPLLRHRIEPLTALAMAAFVILLVSPRALWQAGFQMSFVCVLAIILLKPPLDDWMRFDPEKGSKRRQRLVRMINSIPFLLTTVLAAQIGIFPLLSNYYHRVPLVGMLSNVIVAPLIWALAATALLLLGVAALVPAAAGVFAGAVSFFSHALVGILQWWSGLPAVSVVIPSWPVAAAVAYYLVLFGWVVMPREPSPFFAAKQRARTWIALAAVAAWVVWAPVLLREGHAGLRATFLDVGQGDSCVLELPGGPVVVVDGGSRSAGEFVVASFLESRGVDHVDLVVATHPDADHIGGFPALFHQLDVGWLVEGPGRSESQTYGRLIEAARAEPARRHTVFAGDWIGAPLGVRLLVVHPPRGASFARRNDESVVLMLDWGDCEILLTGDAERAAERAMLASALDLECDVLKVSHHGAAAGTTPGFLARTRPALAVISCGRDNPYGHPAPSVIDRLSSAGVAIVRTDRHGAVTLRCDGKRLVQSTMGKR